MTEIQEFIMTPYDDEVYVLKCDHLKAMEAIKNEMGGEIAAMHGIMDEKTKTIEAQACEIEQLREMLHRSCQ